MVKVNFVIEHCEGRTGMDWTFGDTLVKGAEKRPRKGLRKIFCSCFAKVSLRCPSLGGQLRIGYIVGLGILLAV